MDAKTLRDLPIGAPTPLKRGISPGPWLCLQSHNIEPDDDGVTQWHFGRQIFDIDGKPYTNHMPTSGKDGYVFSLGGYCTEDDARLICAAPEMMGSLRESVAACARLYHALIELAPEHPELHYAHGSMVRARDVLSKACPAQAEPKGDAT